MEKKCAKTKRNDAAAKIKRYELTKANIRYSAVVSRIQQTNFGILLNFYVLRIAASPCVFV